MRYLFLAGQAEGIPFQAVRRRRSQEVEELLARYYDTGGFMPPPHVLMQQQQPQQQAGQQQSEAQPLGEPVTRDGEVSAPSPSVSTRNGQVLPGDDSFRWRAETAGGALAVWVRRELTLQIPTAVLGIPCQCF